MFYRITEPEKTVYRIKDVDAAIATTVAGIVRVEIGKMELDQVQSNRNELTANIREHVRAMVDDWGIEVTRAEILDVNLDEATRTAMLQQLNAERARRAQVTEAEGKKRAVELNADAELYAAEQEAKARRVLADAEAYATSDDRRGDQGKRHRGGAVSGGAETGRGVDGRGPRRRQADDHRAGAGAGCLWRCVQDAERPRVMWTVWWVWIVARLGPWHSGGLAAGLHLSGLCRRRGGHRAADRAGVLGGNLAMLLLVFAVASLAAWLRCAALFGVRKGQVKIWDRDINE